MLVGGDLNGSFVQHVAHTVGELLSVNPFRSNNTNLLPRVLLDEIGQRTRLMIVRSTHSEEVRVIGFMRENRRRGAVADDGDTTTFQYSVQVLCAVGARGTDYDVDLWDVLNKRENNVYKSKWKLQIFHSNFLRNLKTFFQLTKVDFY